MPKRRKKDRRNWALKDVPRHTWNVKTQTCYERTWVVSQHWNNCQWTKSHGLFRTLKLNPSLYGDSITLYFKLSKITVWHLSSFCCLLHPIGSGEFIWIIIKKKSYFLQLQCQWIELKKRQSYLFLQNDPPGHAGTENIARGTCLLLNKEGTLGRGPAEVRGKPATLGRKEDGFAISGRPGVGTHQRRPVLPAGCLGD